MCLGIPGKVVEVRGDVAVVDYGGIVREANSSFVEVKPGDYVIVHAGFVIEKIREEEAEEMINSWMEVLGL